MHFVAVGSLSPEDESFWSGTARSAVLNLRRLGHQVTSIGPLKPEMPLIEWVKERIYRHILRLRYETDRNPAILEARAREANAALRAHADADAVITFYPPDAAYLRTKVPLLVVHDVTWNQLLDFYYPRARVARETIAGGNALDRLGYVNCDRVIMSSRWAAEGVVRDYGIDAEKVLDWPLGINLATLPTHDELKTALALRGRAPCRLLFAGFDWQRKGGDTAIAVARTLHDKGFPVELQIVGIEPPPVALPFVTYVGILSKKDPADAARHAALFKDADFLLLPTRADCTPMVINEAAANALPVLATTVGGVPYLAGNGRWSALLAPDAPAEDYASWIEAVYRDRGRYEDLAWAARRDFDERLNWDAFCSKLCATVKGLKRAR
jgi:glycosyltransferase involved in cell wall biosynthesis